ncbi:MAG: transposase [Deltaproteobacteria bacterium]|nr:transposase [Deltaproteobacteria bacterium]
MIPYSQQFRNRMVQKLSGPYAMSATALSSEVGISQGTLSRWLKQAATIAVPMPPTDDEHTKRPEDWSPEEKVAFVMEAAAVPSDELGAFLRRKGVHEAQLDEWRKQVTESAVAAMRPPNRRAEREAAAAEAKKIRQLEREILRKDKALAETAALLVLQKKVQAIWGDEDDDTDPKSDK